MAIGLGMYFDDLKHKTMDELKNMLVVLNNTRTKALIREMREEQIKFGVDDGNIESDHETEIEVIKTLISYFQMYPESDISKCDNYWDVERAVRNKTGPINTQKERQFKPVDDTKIVAKLKEEGVEPPQPPIFI